MVATLKSLAFAGGTSLIVAVADGTGFDLKELTALGLCAFMVWRNYENQKGLVRLLDTQRADMARKNEQVESLHVETLKIIRQQADALGRRPCLKEEQLGELK